MPYGYTPRRRFDADNLTTGQIWIAVLVIVVLVLGCGGYAIENGTGAYVAAAQQGNCPAGYVSVQQTGYAPGGVLMISQCVLEVPVGR